MKRISILFLILCFVYFSADFFSVASISCELLAEPAEPISPAAAVALSQPYRYLGKGRQSYAFVSHDGKWVVKFFNQKYFQVPFWAFAMPSERSKREKRRQFYLKSYGIASRRMREETGIVYLHQGPNSSLLPHLTATDKMGRSHRIDLNKIPFVLQKKAEPLYPALESMASNEFDEALSQFLTLVAERIDQGIGDGDQDVKNNFGLLDGKIVQIDPGRLYFEKEIRQPERLKYAWSSATRQLRKWLLRNHPEKIDFFDREIEARQEEILFRS